MVDALLIMQIYQSYSIKMIFHGNVKTLDFDPFLDKDVGDDTIF
jgi:hypothetical protein